MCYIKKELLSSIPLQRRIKPKPLSAASEAVPLHVPAPALLSVFLSHL